MKSLILLIGTILPAVCLAHDCNQDLDSEARLACYDRFGSCGSIESKDARLGCYYRAAGIADSSMSAPTGRQDPEASVAPVEELEESTDLSENQIRKDDDAFPVKSTVAPKKSPAPEIHSGIASVSTNARGYILVELENQQVWRLKEKSHYQFERGHQVTIVKGFLGSTVLVDVPSGKRFKISRER